WLAWYAVVVCHADRLRPRGARQRSDIGAPVDHYAVRTGARAEPAQAAKIRCVCLGRQHQPGTTRNRMISGETPDPAAAGVTGPACRVDGAHDHNVAGRRADRAIRVDVRAVRSHCLPGARARATGVAGAAGAGVPAAAT